MIECISELTGHCRGIWTQTPNSTHTCPDRHTHTIPIHTRIVHDMHAHTNMHTYPVTLWLLRAMDQSRLKLSWILHGVWCRTRFIIERWRSFFSLLEIQLSLFAFCRAIVDRGWWSVMPGHLGNSLFFLWGSNRDWDWQLNRNLIKRRNKQTLWIQTLHREEACHASLSNQNAHLKNKDAGGICFANMAVGDWNMQKNVQSNG